MKPRLLASETVDVMPFTDSGFESLRGRLGEVFDLPEFFQVSLDARKSFGQLWKVARMIFLGGGLTFPFRHLRKYFPVS